MCKEKYYFALFDRIYDGCTKFVQNKQLYKTKSSVSCACGTLYLRLVLQRSCSIKTTQSIPRGILYFLRHMHENRLFLSRYLKRARRANLRVYVKSIVSKLHDEYQYSPLEAVLQSFFLCYESFSYFLWSKNSNVQPTLDAWNT